MDAILFSADPSKVNVDDAIRHLSDHEELYWEVGFRISRRQCERFAYPILGYIHICGEQVKYVATIKNIVPYSPSHYEARFKPIQWLSDQYCPWRNALLMTHIKPFSCNTCDFQKYEGGYVKNAPQNYIRVLTKH